MGFKCIFYFSYLGIAYLEGIFGAEYLLDGYTTFGESERYVKNGIQYTLQRFQGKHKNEFLLRSPWGDVSLYESNVLKQQWQENEKEVKSDEFIAYKYGRVNFCQRFQDIYEQVVIYRVTNQRKGLRMEIWSAKSGHLVYHGKFNKKRQREGWGIEYDEENGKMIVEGIWSNGTLTEVIRCFDGDTMTELKRNGKDSLDPVKRIPLYVGGFRYDEDTETFVREGKGCLIDEETGVATRECEWKDGKEVSGRDLIDGWFDLESKFACTTVPIPKPTINLQSSIRFRPVQKMNELKGISLNIKDMVISSNSFNNFDLLDLSQYKYVQSIKIEDDCFQSVKSFKIDGLKQLSSLKIGSHSFTEATKDFLSATHTLNEWKQINNPFKSFHVINCPFLKSIEIGQYSFSDFGRDFELKNLPLLQSISIGQTDKDSSNFLWSSFEVCSIAIIV